LGVSSLVTVDIFMSAAAPTILVFSVVFAGPRLRLDEADDSGLFVLGTAGTPESRITLYSTP
jgi:hypothetical protein